MEGPVEMAVEVAVKAAHNKMRGHRNSVSVNGE